MNRLQNLLVALVKASLLMVKSFDRYLWRCLHRVVQGCKMLLTTLAMALNFVMPSRILKRTWSAVLMLDRTLWQFCNVLARGVVMLFISPIKAVREVANKTVQFMVHAVYGFVWVAKLPYNTMVFGGKVLSTSSAHMSDYTQNLVQMVKAFVARIFGALRTYYGNVKGAVINKEELPAKMREMWNESNAKVDTCVKEAGSLLKPVDVPESASLYVKNKSVISMILMRLYARLHLHSRILVEKFNNAVKAISFEYHRIMTTSEKAGDNIHSPIHRAINNRPNRAVMIMFVSMTGLVTAFIIWAAIIEIQGYVHARGRIETYDQLQTITAFDGAIVEKIMVEEDQSVVKGQELIRFDNSIFQARYNDLQERYYAKLGSISALEARIAGTPLVLDDAIKAFSPRIYSDIEASYKAGLNVNNTSLMVLDSQITRKEKEVSDATRDQNLYVQHLDLVKKQVDILTKLAANELVSKLRLLEVQKEMLNTQIKLKNVETDLLRIEGELKELQDRRANFVSNFHKDMLSELSKCRDDLSSIAADMTAAKDRLARTVVVSPIAGTIYKISNKAVVGHTISGQEVISIVPSSGGLVMTGLVPPSEIGFVKKGQEVAIKVATYDYSIYGSLNGVVERISPETIQNKTDGIFYYEVVVKSEHNYLEHKGRKLYIKPGMDATADFEMDSRTILRYMIDPFVKTMHESLSER